MWVQAPNARGVTPGQGQTVRVAGMRVGDVGDVELKDGKALIRMDLDPEHDRPRARGRHRPAAPAHRPEGHVPRAGPRHARVARGEGERDDQLSANALADINADEVLEALDTDTRVLPQAADQRRGQGPRGPR